MEAWWELKSEEHELDLEDRREAREHAILLRLSDIGWGEEIEHQRRRDGVSCLDEFKIGTQAKELTERDWNDLRPRLEEALQGAKEARLLAELLERWKRRFVMFKAIMKGKLGEHRFNTVGPSVFDLARLPRFQEKLLLPIDHELKAGDFSELFVQLPQIRTDWIQAREADLVDVLKMGGVIDATTDLLRFATTIFRCTRCDSPCVYPRPLIHECSKTRDMTGYRYLFSSLNSPSFEDFLGVSYGRVWESSCFAYDKQLSTAAQDILSILGLPASATVEDVRSVDGWLKYHDSLGRRVFYPVMRAMYETSLQARPGWAVATEAEVADAERNAQLEWHYGASECVHCGAVLCGWWETKGHLRDVHGLPLHTLHRLHIILEVDAPLTRLQYRQFTREPSSLVEGDASSLDQPTEPESKLGNAIGPGLTEFE
ncbi:hypothetical protein AAF712_008986 [Marasmius tenuissimus]|uniref:C2H2-type domain-containing protein n=1 Tax=Marasmius tenuissimus TaxID=585030 RepID=A0ABR2ZSP2_9AGAR